LWYLTSTVALKCDINQTGKGRYPQAMYAKTVSIAAHTLSLATLIFWKYVNHVLPVQRMDHQSYQWRFMSPEAPTFSALFNVIVVSVLRLCFLICCCFLFCCCVFWFVVVFSDLLLCFLIYCCFLICCCVFWFVVVF